MRLHACLAMVCALSCGQAPPTAPDGVWGAAPAAKYLKGQLHLHSNNSGDSETPPADVARWYAEHGYDFIVFTDHNRVTTGVVRDDLLVFAGMEVTINVERCDPPPPGPLCPLHVNALFVDPGGAAPALADPPDLRRTTLYRHGIAIARAMGGLAQINHPNFHWAADADTIAAVADGPLLLEIANEAIDSVNEGDATHPSTIAMWDALLARGVRVWGTATDDAHHYDDADRVRARGELAFEGDRGFVMVRAPAETTAAGLRDAMARGDFYASNGALLDDVACDPRGLTVWPADAHAIVRCVSGSGAGDPIASGGALGCPRPGPRAYVRAEIVERDGRRAWTQPCWPD